MFLRKLFFVVGFFLLASANCHATTVAEECAKRAKSAYDIGATDKQKETLGNIALSECFKEMEDSLKKGGNSSSNDGSSSDSGGDKGEIAQWFAGLFIGLIGGVGILFIAEIFTRTAMERYRFFRGAMILFGGLVVVLYLVSISTPSLLGPSRSFDLETLVSTIWTLSTIFFRTRTDTQLA